MGIWSEIKPKGQQQSEWKFASYWEIRDDGQWYTAFLFRDEERTKFGVHEWVGPAGQRLPDLRHMAVRVIADKGFRDSLLSERADLPKLWKKR